MKSHAKDKASIPIRFGAVESFHFVGIGGIGMSGIAEILLRAGLRVSGSDLRENAQTERLRKMGAQVYLGHRESNLGEAGAVVFSSAVPAQNPELQAARKQGLPQVHRGEMLAELMRFYRGIAVCGTHGKSTTASMIATVLLRAKLEPTILIGARLASIQSNARLGTGPFLVAEADESDRSFLRLNPHYAVATNIDLEHMDEYRDLEDLKQAFLTYLSGVPFYGAAVACLDDPNLAEVLKKLHRRVVTYGLGLEAEIRATEIELVPFRCSYTCTEHGNRLGRIDLQVPARHNVLNSLAAVAVGRLLRIPFSAIQQALAGFQGAERRFQLKGEKAGVLVIDDYGHHPAEIRATLEAARQLERRLLMVFQPHRYSRTRHLMDELAGCFGQTGLLYLMDVYGAGERPIPGVDSERLAQLIEANRQVRRVGDAGELVSLLREEAREGDVILTLGAGDVWKIGEAYLEE